MSDDETNRGTELIIILEREEDGSPSETIERKVPRNILTKAQYRRKAKQNKTWRWNGTIRIDLSEEGLNGDRSGMVDIKYLEGGVFVPSGESDS